jgi:hypothetical protein
MLYYGAKRTRRQGQIAKSGGVYKRIYNKLSSNGQSRGLSDAGFVDQVQNLLNCQGDNCQGDGSFDNGAATRRATPCFLFDDPLIIHHSAFIIPPHLSPGSWFLVSGFWFLVPGSSFITPHSSFPTHPATPHR